MSEEKSFLRKFVSIKGIVTSIIVYLIVFTLESTAPILVGVFTDLSQTFSNYYYSQLSNLSSYLYLFELNFIAIIGYTIFMFDVSSKLFVKIKKIGRQVNGYVEKVIETKEKNNNEKKQFGSEVEPKDLELDIENTILETHILVTKTDKLLKRFKYQLIPLITLTIVSLIAMLTLSSSIEHDILEFKKKTRVLKPYITSYEYDLFYSDWSRMDSKAKYKKIIRRLDKLTIEHIN